MSGKRYSEKLRKDAARLYRKGWSLARIVRREEMPDDVNTVRHWLKDRGVEMRVSVHVYPRQKILRELERDVPRLEIQERYGCSAKYLSNLATGKLEVVEEEPVKKPVKKKAAKKKPVKKKPARKKN